MKMINNLQKTNIIIKEEELNDEFYFQSLLEQGRSKDLITAGDIERIQYECLAFLAHKTERFDAGDSSSVRVEKAQDIMASNLFTIGLWLKTYQNPDDAISAILNNKITELYQKGRKRIDTMVAAAKTIHHKMLQQLVDTKNEFYHATIADGINGFFKLYNPDYNAHEIHITADYPIFNMIPKLAGIEFINTYLNALYYENQFCLYFSSDDIHRLLCGYKEDYHELLINIYEHVLTAVIGCIIAETDCDKLNITNTGEQFLNQFFLDKSKTEILEIISNAAMDLNRRFQFSRGLGLYIQNSLSTIAGNIALANQMHTLNKIFYMPA